jgi:HSP20 family protein
MSLIKSNFFPFLPEDLFKDDFFGITEKQNSLPLVNIKDDANNFYVDVVAPGINKDDVKLELTGQTLTIRYEHKNESEEKKENFFRREFRQTSFARSFTLPNTADIDNISANFTDGIVKITIPKKDSAKPKEPRTISIG